MATDFVAKNFSGVNSITHGGIVKHFKNIEPTPAIAELVWNGFDAAATCIKVTIRETTAHGTESITVLDNGNGIDFHNADDNFRRFNDSLKRDSYDAHGSQGRGRLAILKFCHLAQWFTRYGGEDAKIAVSSDNLSAIAGTTIPISDQHALLQQEEKGTCVELTTFRKNLPSIDSISQEFTREFGGHLILMPDRKLYVNEILIEPQKHTITTRSIITDRGSYEISLIHWENKPGADKSYIHFIGSKSKTLFRLLSSLNNKPDYYTTIHIKSDSFVRYEANGSDLCEPFSAFINSEEYRTLVKSLNGFIRDHYAQFLIDRAQEQVDTFERNGDFPEYSNLSAAESAWRLGHVKEIVKAVLMRDPKILISGNKQQRRLIIRLLDRLSVSNENSGIFEVLESVLNLDSISMNQLATQLKRTKLDNIIQTIELLQNRELSVSQLKEVMNTHYKDVLETPDLQMVIENNTWLFGPAYEIIGAEEDSFTKTTQALRSRIKTIDDIEAQDLAENVEISGAKRQVDLFLARKKPETNSRGQRVFRCAIIEIKRPGISLNNKHLQQLDEYAAILSSHSEFNSELMRFELILVGRTISKEAYSIHSRIKSAQIHGEPGLVTSDDKVKAYVKTWPTIFDEFDLTNEYLLGQLKTQRQVLTDLSKDDLLKSLQGQESDAPA